jgi:phenylacetate-CoA ligase
MASFSSWSSSGLTVGPRAYFEPEVELLTASEVHALQLKLLQETVERAYHTNAFFGPRYRAAGIDPGDIRTLDDIRRLPIVRKDDILADIAAQPPYGTRLQADTSEIVNVVESSGTSRRGREVQALSAADFDGIVRAEAFGFYWAGARRGTVVALMAPLTMAAAGVWWTHTLQRLESNTLRLADADTEKRLEYMKRYGVEVLITNANYLRRMEHIAEQLGYEPARDFPKLRSVFGGGGSWTLEWARERSERWHSNLYEQYGSSQRAIAWTCERGMVNSGGYGVIHGLPHLSLLEVLNPATGEPVNEGEEGEVIVTVFNQEAQPQIRYGSNDRAIYMPASACPCGRAFDGLRAGSIGRYDDMLKIKNVNIWPETFDRLVFAHPQVAEYRVDVTMAADGREDVVIALEYKRGVTAEQRGQVASGLGQAVRRDVGFSVSVHEWMGESLVAGGADLMKVKRVTDKRGGTS